jgi:hypothetical protein
MSTSSPVVKWWKFASSSNPNKMHETQLHADGEVTCGCPGWCKHVADDGSRACRHTRSVEAGTADREATATGGSGNSRRAAPAAQAPAQKAKAAPKPKFDESVSSARKVQWD